MAAWAHNHGPDWRLLGVEQCLKSRCSLRARTWWVRVFVAAGERVRNSSVLRGTPWPWFAEGSECMSRDNVKSSRTWVVGSPEWRSAQATAPEAYSTPSLAKHTGSPVLQSSITTQRLDINTQDSYNLQRKGCSTVFVFFKIIQACR
jgi:hypothetical protein